MIKLSEFVTSNIKTELDHLCYLDGIQISNGGFLAVFRPGNSINKNGKYWGKYYFATDRGKLIKEADYFVFISTAINLQKNMACFLMVIRK